MRDSVPQPETPWRTVDEAAARAKVSDKTIYRAIADGMLRAARVGGRRAVRLRDEWIDQWLERESTPVEIPR
jgi:excisionase family DNA binding protein